MKLLRLMPKAVEAETLRLGSRPGGSQMSMLDTQRMVAVPDLLHEDARLSVDPDAVQELLELSFLGKEGVRGLERVLGREEGGADWDLDLFAEDLFVRELIRDGFALAIDGLRYPINETFLYQVLSAPPTEVSAVQFRQNILRELEGSPELLRATRDLYREASKLLTMFKSPDHAAQLDINAFRLDIFRQAKRVVDLMHDNFDEATSGLRRLFESAATIRSSQEYERLCDLLEYESRQSTLQVTLNIGGDGEVKDLQLHDIADNTSNPFFTPHLQRLMLRFRAMLVGYRLSHKVIVNGILRRVFEEISGSLVPLVQVIGHLEPYLCALSFRDRMAEQGFAVSLPEVVQEGDLRFDTLFNPLLLATGEKPVPCDLQPSADRRITLITGPNSGGKTRLLQSLGLAQLLGQSGLYVPAKSSRIPLVRGMFVSLVETETADQAEGRLGREMLRIRSLFQTMGSPSLVILDELCSGTNPSEGIEIFSLVLRLLERLETRAFISTHFLEFANQMQTEPPIDGLDFLQVESKGLASTYQFVAGVAKTSLASETAERLGVTFDELAEIIDQRKTSAD